MKKAYIVTFEMDYIALAENEEDAKQFARQALDDCGYPWREYCSVGPLTHLPADWEENCLVYHDGDEDITVKQATEMSPEYQETQAKMKAFQDKYKASRDVAQTNTSETD